VPNLPRYIATFLEATSAHLHPRPFLFSLLMFVLEEPQSRKRPRSSLELRNLEPEPIVKKQKSFPESCAQPRHRPATFWDTLSKVRLTRGALREFDRRNVEEKVQPPCTLTPNVEYPTGRARLRLKRFARGGGSDLSHLRGVRLFYADVGHGN